MDFVTVTTSTGGDNRGFLYFKDSDTSITRNFECGSYSTRNNGGEMYLEIKNCEFTNYILNNAQASLHGAIIYGFNFDSILEENAPKMTIDTITITNILGGNNVFIILNINLLTEQLNVHTPDVSDTWLIRQRTNLFDFGSNMLRSYQVYFDSFDFAHIDNKVFTLDSVIGDDLIILNNNNYTHVNGSVLVISHNIEYNYNLTIFINTNYTL